jgi:hypothetical protein
MQKYFKATDAELTLQPLDARKHGEKAHIRGHIKLVGAKVVAS